MAEEKQIAEEEMVDDTLSQDDTDVLREVLESEHSRGITPVSLYNQSEALDFDGEEATRSFSA